MPKNIVICLDGTGNQIEENLSNVLKLYRTLKKNDEQVVFYDQGVGTLGQVNAWGRFTQWARNLLGMGFGLGLDDNVLQAYEFLVRHYREHKVEYQKQPVGDNIYIFGFSRGAHTARVLAAMIYKVGILRPNQIHLSGAALTAYKQGQDDDDAPVTEDEYEGESMNFRRVANTLTASIKFLGVWDTVSSVLIPNPNGIFPPLVRENLPNIYSQGEAEDQDMREIWFPGYHSDVGGGHKRRDSGISQYPLIWMSEQAEKAGLKIFGRMSDYVTGVQPWTKDTKYLYPSPDPAAKVHNSMNIIWRLAEFLLKRNHPRKWPKRCSFLGYYFPAAEPRLIPENSEIHHSVYDRMAAVPKYRPVNVRPREEE